MKLVPGIEKLAVKMHAGNFVAIRNRSKPPGSDKIFESMPIYARYVDICIFDFEYINYVL